MKLSKLHIFLICIIVVSLITTGVVIALNLPKVSYSLNQPNTSESTEEVEFFPKSKEEALEFLVGTWREEYTSWQNIDWLVNVQRNYIYTFSQIKILKNGTFEETRGYIHIEKPWGQEKLTHDDYKHAIEEQNEKKESGKGFIDLDEGKIYFVFLDSPPKGSWIGNGMVEFNIKYIKGNPDKIEIILGKDVSSATYERIK